MVRIEWDLPQERFYETGLDRGVLYALGRGVAWNGLTRVRELNVGGNIDSSYYDGVAVTFRQTPEQYCATIEAFTYPEEFERCLGDDYQSGPDGATFGLQRRLEFGLSYRTLIGEGASDAPQHYKIHLIYHAMVSSPSTYDRVTLTNIPSPMTMSWQFKARHETFPGIGVKPTAKVTIDSRTTDPYALQDLEDILYGYSSEEPRLPTGSELVDLLQNGFMFRI